MKKATLLAALLIWSGIQLAHAGYLKIINQNSNYDFSGQVIATNDPLAPSDANASYSYVYVPAGGSVTYADPTAVPSPSGPGAPPLASGVFLGVKGGCVGISLDGTVGRAGTYLGYSQMQNHWPSFIVIWTPVNADDVVITIF